MTENELVAAAKQGDQRAFAELVTKYRRVVFSVCRQITGNQSDAEDAVQDALTSAWQHLSKFRGDSKFSTWLHKIAANAALAICRRRKETSVDIDDFVDLEDIVTPIDERVGNVDLVRRAISELPDEFKVPIVLREFCDMTYQEIADHQGIPVATVKTRLSRARRRLREALSEHPLKAG